MGDIADRDVCPPFLITRYSNLIDVTDHASHEWPGEIKGLKTAHRIFLWALLSLDRCGAGRSPGK